jgi:hypothetical protein
MCKRNEILIRRGFVLATYLFAISLLPNRVFYTQFHGLSSTDIQRNATQVAQYAAMEIASLMLFCSVVNRYTKSYSVLRQLAFSLETHWGMLQAVFALWVYLIVQLPLEHFGTLIFVGINERSCHLDSEHTPRTAIYRHGLHLPVHVAPSAAACTNDWRSWMKALVFTLAPAHFQGSLRESAFASLTLILVDADIA